MDGRDNASIGPYRVLDTLGEGGMGVVYEAEQRQPIFRRVALKVIKIGMDTKEVLARFEAERQALALLDHPNIAKVLDAGATPEGRPFFAMELVRGLPITRYCDERRLPVKERVEILLQACAALQHAHDRGILHRDVKPTNLLVAEVDDKPFVKVIDFGLAKATNQRLTERTLFTEQGRIIGTPEYMSPEQAETSAQDVDVRSDVFSLGVVLYELLAGALPFDFQSVRAKGYLEVQRVIREEEPPTPRQRLSSLKNSLDHILALRRCRLQELAGSLRDGLDAVTMKAISKQRRDRYASCAEFAADLQRFLAGEPVSAKRIGIVRGAWANVRRFRRRHPAITPLLVGLVLGPVVLIVVAVLYVQSQIPDLGGKRMNVTAPASSREASIAAAVETFERSGVIPKAAEGRRATLYFELKNESSQVLDKELLLTQIRTTFFQKLGRQIKVATKPRQLPKPPDAANPEGLEFLVKCTFSEGALGGKAAQPGEGTLRLELIDLANGEAKAACDFDFKPNR